MEETATAQGNKQFSVRLPPDLFNAATRAARDDDRPMQYLLRQGLRELLKRKGYLKNGERDG